MKKLIISLAVIISSFSATAAVSDNTSTKPFFLYETNYSVTKCTNGRDTIFVNGSYCPAGWWYAY